MDAATFDRLLTAEGRAALVAAAELGPTEAKYPAHADRLRKHFPTDLARAALDTAMLREKARGKFSRAGEMFFTREALEMATGEAVARARAGRFAGFATVADLGCGIGGDAIGLALAGPAVAAVDRDPLHLRMAEANLAAYGLTARFARADLLTDTLPAANAAFADPGRRPGGRRRLSVDDYEPPVGALLARLPAGHPVGVKVAPGVPWDDLRRFEAEAEFVSLDGELKECVLWFGPLRRGRVRATVLPGPHALADADAPPAVVGPPAGFLIDPDPAVTRSGLTDALATRLPGARRIDPEIALLTTDTPNPTPFAAVYRIDTVIPFRPKGVADWLRAHRVGRVTVVKRGLPADADELLARWRFPGDEHRAVVLTRAEGKPVAVVGERVGGEPSV